MIQKIIRRKAEREPVNTRKLPRLPKVRAAAYCRVSTAHELQEDSFDVQMETYKKKIENDPALTLAGLYGDLGCSGTQIKGRDQFQQMMDDCRDGKIDLIYVKSISRFGRNMADVIDSIRELKKLHVRVIFEKEGLDTADQQTELVFGIMATIAEEESRSISSNLNWSRRARLKKGKPYGQVTYGYRERKDHTWYVYEPEAERVRTAFRMAIECRNYTEIRDALQLMEEHDETGKKWIQSNLQYLLTNPYYTGVYISNKTVDTLIEGRGKVRVENKGERGQFIIENHHDALISKENFEMVEKLVETKALYTPKNWRKQHGEYSDKENAESA